MAVGTMPTKAQTKGNLRWAVLFALADLALFCATAWVGDRVTGPGLQLVGVVLVVTVILAPVALIWLVGEAHLR